MTFLDRALELAKKGFHVFPLRPNSKLPGITDFPELATTDPATIKNWWMDPVLETVQPFNIGISTSRFGTNESLVVVDVDNKGKKKGDNELLRLEIEQGKEFPDTLTQTTPSGGRHLVYKAPFAVKQGTDVLAKGLDIRSRGGFIVAAGSVVDGKEYAADGKEITDCPDWIVSVCGKPHSKSDLTYAPDPNEETAIPRVIYYLEFEAPLSREGEAGDQTAYIVACRVKDFGVSLETATHLLSSHWNDRCSPPWSYDELDIKVRNAYRYGNEPVGVASPEAQFEPLTPQLNEELLHPFQELNKEFAFVVAGGGSHILWETVGPKEEFKLEHLGIPTFHQKLAAKTVDIGDGNRKQLSALWMKSQERRSYDGICFMPGKKSPPRFYNLWRGFAVQPYKTKSNASKEDIKALEDFLDHAKHNVCRNDEGLFNWLIGFFAHIVQKPWEKPLVALVFRGGKGVGKNALIDRVGYLLGSHYLLTSNRRYLVSNFNGYLENCLLFTLDEAFWSGDKQAEGTLKDLITGKHHVIEHKGKEPYTVENCTRLVIIGNEEWLVPASQDERRYAVFDVGDGKKQDRNFFGTMREGMERGGYRLLLRFLLDYDLQGIDLNGAPQTKGLLDQKLASLDPFERWVFECINQGRILGGDFGNGNWDLEVDKDRFRGAFRRHARDLNIRSRYSDDRTMGKKLKTIVKSLGSGKKRDSEGFSNYYRFPPLETARREFETWIGQPIDWEKHTHES